MGQGRHWSITIVPADPARSREVRVSGLAVRLFALAALVLIAAGVTMAVTYGKMVREAGKTRRLAAEVRRLRSDNAKIVELAGELDAIRERESQLRDLLGLSPLSETSGDEAGGVAKHIDVPPTAEPGHEAPDLWPVKGAVSRSYTTDAARRHDGVDIAGRTGTPILAAGSGVVEFAGIDTIFGNMVRIDHENGYATLYGHNSRLAARIGQRISRGQVVAYLGSTGRSSAPHLHFEVRHDGLPVDPLTLMQPAGGAATRSK